MHEVAARDDVYITVLTGTGRFFSAGADVSSIGSGAGAGDGKEDRKEGGDVQEREKWLKNFVAGNLHITHAFHTHPNILITALSGPAVGLSAALIAHSDFIYSAPHAYLLTPFSSLGLVTEGAACISLMRRLGLPKANEALILGKRITCAELLATGFVNKVFDGAGDERSEGYSDRFLGLVMQEVRESFEGLNGESVVGIKRLIQGPWRGVFERSNVDEVMGGLERFVKGVPQEEFGRVARGERRHKL
ncbi:peroxisomal-enoyl-isomerase protein [Pyrenophora tritici-repentis]|nr:peroxisomal-enoyl-isomerase protein [Pyrenophora tritici-repentis]KAI0604529.1 peroxisomal-enoyl-isomerase protein [Pyrenophora tritici-repentis]KAI0616819.1 peroxisomal-enoyl-isomerase protein [Pyrenophora tritici-repentis]